MRIIRNPVFRPLAAGLALPLLALLLAFAGCDIESADSTTAVPSDNDGTVYNYSGLYMSANNTTNSTNGYATLVFPTNGQSGTLLTWLRLLQYGSVLEAYDNAGLTWDGGISSIQGGTASFNLVGRTTAGQPVEIAGTLTYANQQSTMNATWIEPNFAGSIFATATVSPATTNTPVGGEVTLTASSGTIASNGTVTLTASGGTGSYSWSLSTSAFGSLAHSSSHATNSYTRTSGTSTDSVTITVTSGTDSDSESLDFL